MRRVDYKDRDGRWWAVWLPEDYPDERAPMGVPIGPPPLDELELPEGLAIELHNQLFKRGLLTKQDLVRRLGEVQIAITSALRLDVQRVTALYE